MANALTEPDTIEKEIVAKAKQWVEAYGQDFLDELIDAYLDDTPDHLARLREALARGDVVGLTREAHTVKSSSANMGAMRLSSMAKEMEAAGRSGKLVGIAEVVTRVEAEYAHVKWALETVRKLPQALGFKGN